MKLLERRSVLLTWLAFAAWVLPLAPTVVWSSEIPVVGGPCDRCEHVFEGMPEDLSSTAVVAAPDAGEPLHLRMQVLDPGGIPASGVVVYAYQTDAGGIYPGRSVQAPHGTLRGWARSDDRGFVAFETIRPGSYPDSRVAQHIHLHVIEPGRCTYFISDVNFADDPLLSPLARRRADRARGGDGVVEPRLEDGVWEAERSIHLGRNVPGYAECR